MSPAQPKILNKYKQVLKIIVICLLLSVMNILCMKIHILFEIASDKQYFHYSYLDALES